MMRFYVINSVLFACQLTFGIWPLGYHLDNALANTYTHLILKPIWHYITQLVITYCIMPADYTITSLCVCVAAGVVCGLI